MEAEDGRDQAVRRATVADVPQLAPLFAAYREFYGVVGTTGDAAAFLTDRLERDESVIYIATGAGGAALGFVQVYPTFSSVDMRPAWRLNDLFVAEHGRRAGVGRALMRAAEQAAVAAGAVWIDLETATDNRKAQALYESEGYQRDMEFIHYVKSI